MHKPMESYIRRKDGGIWGLQHFEDKGEGLLLLKVKYLYHYPDPPTDQWCHINVNSTISFMKQVRKGMHVPELSSLGLGLGTKPHSDMSTTVGKDTDLDGTVMLVTALAWTRWPFIWLATVCERTLLLLLSIALGWVSDLGPGFLKGIAPLSSLTPFSKTPLTWLTWMAFDISFLTEGSIVTCNPTERQYRIGGGGFLSGFKLFGSRLSNSVFTHLPIWLI